MMKKTDKEVIEAILRFAGTIRGAQENPPPPEVVSIAENAMEHLPKKVLSLVKDLSDGLGISLPCGVSFAVFMGTLMGMDSKPVGGISAVAYEDVIKTIKENPPPPEVVESLKKELGTIDPEKMESVLKASEKHKVDIETALAIVKVLDMTPAVLYPDGKVVLSAMHTVAKEKKSKDDFIAGLDDSVRH